MPASIVKAQPGFHYLSEAWQFACTEICDNQNFQKYPVSGTASQHHDFYLMLKSQHKALSRFEMLLSDAAKAQLLCNGYCPKVKFPQHEDDIEPSEGAVFLPHVMLIFCAPSKKDVSDEHMSGSGLSKKEIETVNAKVLEQLDKTDNKKTRETLYHEASKALIANRVKMAEKEQGHVFVLIGALKSLLPEMWRQTWMSQKKEELIHNATERLKQLQKDQGFVARNTFGTDYEAELANVKKLQTMTDTPDTYEKLAENPHIANLWNLQPLGLKERKESDLTTLLMCSVSSLQSMDKPAAARA